MKNQMREKLNFLKEKGYTADKDGNIYSYTGKKLFIRKNKSEHNFTAKINGKIATITQHKFIAYLKYGDKIFENKNVVYHKNGNVDDNSWNNILYGTRTDVMMAIPGEKRNEKANKAAATQRKFTDEQVLEIIQRKKEGISLSKIAEEFNSRKSSISYLLNNSTYAKKLMQV